MKKLAKAVLFIPKCLWAAAVLWWLGRNWSDA
jgi:hypothetical protein